MLAGPARTGPWFGGMVTILEIVTNTTKMVVVINDNNNSLINEARQAPSESVLACQGDGVWSRPCEGRPARRRAGRHLERDSDMTRM